MKHLLLPMLLSAFPLMCHSQNPLSPADTLVGRQDRCYYLPYWYDHCPLYTYSVPHFVENPYTLTDITREDETPIESCNQILAEEHYAFQPMGLLGVMVLTSTQPGLSSIGWGIEPLSPERKPEYIYIAQGDTLVSSLPDFYYPRHMHMVDSIRWDTVAPHLLRLPLNASGTDYLPCLAYEVWFPVPVKVQDTFYIIGTSHSNVINMNLYDGFTNLPTTYFTLLANNLGVGCDRCTGSYRLFSTPGTLYQQMWDAWTLRSYNRSLVGPFLPIVNQVSLTATSANPSRGTVSGSGRYPAGWQVTIEALPNPGYSFSHWDDGSTLNPRTILLSSNTTLSASFSPL